MSSPSAPAKKIRPAAGGARQEKGGSPMPSVPSVRKNPPAGQRIIRTPREETPEVLPQKDAEQPEDIKGSEFDDLQQGIPSEKVPPYIPPPPLQR